MKIERSSFWGTPGIVIIVYCRKDFTILSNGGSGERCHHILKGNMQNICEMQIKQFCLDYIAKNGHL